MSCLVDDPQLEEYFRPLLLQLHADLATWYKTILPMSSNPFALTTTNILSFAALEAASGSSPDTSTQLEIDIPVARPAKRWWVPIEVLGFSRG
jgi:hypothetical protein